jgi:hypothetical protein
MEFRDYAANETTALISRLLAARSEAALQQLRTLRDAFEAAARVAEAAPDPPPQAEADIQELVRRLNAAASSAVRATAKRIQDEAAAALAAAQADLDAERTRAEELSALLAEAQTHVESLRDEVHQEAQRASAAERELIATRALHEEADAARLAAEQALGQQEQARVAVEEDLQETRSLLDTALSEAAGLHAQIDAAAVEKDVLSSERARLAVERADLQTALEAADAHAREQSEARAAAEHELLHLRRSLEDAIAESARLTIQLEEAAAERGAFDVDLNGLRGELDELRARYAGVEAERDFNRETVQSLEAAQIDQAEAIRSLESRLQIAAEAEASLRADAIDNDEALVASRAQVNTLHNRMDRLASLLDAAVLAAVELDHSDTIAGLLACLVRQLAGVYSRVAVFRLKGNRLEGEYQIGFDLSTDVTKLVIPLSVDSLIARAATSGILESLSGADLDDSRHAPFGTSAAAAFAIPVVVRDETLAVVYAEEPELSDGDTAPVEQHATFARLLVRHAVALLMRLSDELKAFSELREYARLLLQEAEQMHEADSQAGKAADEMRGRLKDTLDCARQLFAQRAALEGPAAASLLDDQIAEVIDSQAGTAFARDLAAALGLPESRSRAAEAS